MAKRIAVLVGLLIFGVALAKFFGANETGIPLVTLYGFVTGLVFGFTAVCTLPFKILRSFSISALVGAVALFWLFEAVLIAALLI